ncbi:MAG: hypothetical protein HOV94_00715 [Saccharothrix sp.]|nr:hypothetical protein [Saccharothrix sp.]
MTNPDQALVAVRRIASFGTFVAALEMLSKHERFGKGDLLGAQWDTYRPGFATRHPRAARVLSSKAVPIAGYAVQAAVSAATFAWPRNRALQAVGGTVLALLRTGQQQWNTFGGDGADDMQQVVNVVLASTALVRDRGKGTDLAMRALTLETTLAYVASGLVKAVSPVWLKGDAVAGVMRTKAYGDPRVSRLLTKYPALSKAVSWGTIASELGFPLVFVLPRPAARLYLLSMAAFHAGIGQFMGLNRFLVAFGATHPAVDYVLARRAAARAGER